MKTITNRVGNEVKIFTNTLEQEVYDQIKSLANFEPYLNETIRVMPDAHVGKGSTIGTTLTITNKVTPNLVGVDIGCGMCSLRTNLKDIDRDDLKQILGKIRKTIPVGFKHHKEIQDESWMPPLEDDLPIVRQEYNSGRYQVGTLGGGNHFVEIQKGSDGYIWIMVHSGSRNIGYTVANHYHKLAVKETKERGNNVPKDLSYFVKGSENYDRYFREMNYCIDFALQNRKLMMERVKNAFENAFSDVLD